MAWVAVNKNGSEGIFRYKPYRVAPNKSIYGSKVFTYWRDMDVNGFGNEDTEISLPKGTIKKLIGKELKWEDNPVELKEDTKEMIAISMKDYRRFLSYANYMENWAPDTYKCPMCGTLNPRGYICIECNYDVTK